MRKIEGIKNRDDDIASIVGLRAKARPNFRPHYEEWRKGKGVGLWKQQASLDGRQTSTNFRFLNNN